MTTVAFAMFAGCVWLFALTVAQGEVTMALYSAGAALFAGAWVAWEVAGRDRA